MVFHLNFFALNEIMGTVN